MLLLIRKNPPQHGAMPMGEGSRRGTIILYFHCHAKPLVQLVTHTLLHTTQTHV